MSVQVKNDRAYSAEGRGAPATTQVILGLTKQVWVVDAETGSDVDLRAQGGAQYWASPETRVFMLGYKPLWSNERAGLSDFVASEDRLPQELVAAIAAPPQECMLAAANVEFDRQALQRLGYPTAPEKWLDILVCGYILGFSGRLGDVLRQSPLTLKKNPQGASCITTFSKNLEPWYTKPLLWQTFREYCRDDVDTAAAFLQWTLTWLNSDWMRPSVRKIMHQELIYREINKRGIPIDREAVDGAERIANIEKDFIMTRLKELTGLANPNSGQQLLPWLQSMGSQLTNLQKANVLAERERLEELLKDPLVSDNEAHCYKTVVDALVMRQESSKTSTSKFAAMSRSACPWDDRVRGGWQFYGASRTGRVAGRVINPANLAQPRMERPDLAVMHAAAGDHTLFQTLYPENPVLQTLSWCIRACLLAPEGKQWCVADLTSIESVGLAWQAGCQSILDIFFAGRDTYKTFAAAAEGISYDEVTKAQRSFYKPCLAGDTELLTRRGWVRIIDISDQDELWDGEEWVAHEGLIFKGNRPVITRAGITATPDHKFLVKGMWRNFSDLTVDDFNRETWWVPGEFSNSSTPPPVTFVSVPTVKRSSFVPSGTCPAVARSVACPAPTPGEAIGTPPLRHWAYRRRTGSDSPIASTHYVLAAATHAIARTLTTGAAVSNAGSRVLKHLWNILLRSMGGMIPSGRLTVSTTTGTTSRGTYGSPTEAAIPATLASIHSSIIGDEPIPPLSSTGNARRGTGIPAPLAERSSKEKPRSKSSQTNPVATVPTFDVTNAGPRHRFMVKTADGVAIASNCVLGGGYKMSGYGLSRYAAGFSVEMSVETGNRHIGVFRETYHEIVHYWDQVETAALAAVENPGRLFSVFAVDSFDEWEEPFTGRIERAYRYKAWPRTDYWYDGTFLFARLPSGRHLCYYRPTVEPVTITPKNGKPFTIQRALHYWGNDQKATGNKWTKLNVHAGLLTENNTQALCRDVMWVGLELIESDPYLELVGDCYDEGMALSFLWDKTALDRMIEYITTRAPWMDKNFFLGADGYLRPRYDK